MNTTLQIGPPLLIFILSPSPPHEKNYLKFHLMTSHLYSHTTTDVKSEMIPCMCLNRKYKIRGIAHAHTSRKDDIFMQRRLVQNFTYICGFFCSSIQENFSFNIEDGWETSTITLMAVWIFKCKSCHNKMKFKTISQDHLLKHWWLGKSCDTTIRTIKVIFCLNTFFF